MASAFEQELARLLVDLADCHMPFGRFGPDHFPPRGIPLYDLPYEYLAYFERHGYPRGKLGERMKVVHDLKRDGAEAILVPLRRRAGGRASLRKGRPGRQSTG